MKVYVVGGNKDYANWIDDCLLVDDAFKADLIIFTGGEDVSPHYYGEDKGKFTHCNWDRDEKELKEFVLNRKKPKLGICRGSQFLTVMNGGKLIQHVNNHAINGTHQINTEDGTFEITSTHHQMMFPYNLTKNKYEILGWSAPKLSDTYLNGDDEEIELPNDFLEPEIVHYPLTRSLAVQGHPEQMNKAEIHKYLKSLIKKI